MQDQFCFGPGDTDPAQDQFIFEPGDTDPMQDQLFFGPGDTDPAQYQFIFEPGDTGPMQYQFIFEPGDTNPIQDHFVFGPGDTDPDLPVPRVVDAANSDMPGGVMGDKRRYLMQRFAWAPRAIHTLLEAKAPFTFVGHGPLEMSSCFSATMRYPHGDTGRKGLV